MNKAILIGNLARDPECKATSGGITVTKFTVAVARRKKDDGADFIPCVTFGKLAENCAKYLAKGNRAAVYGSIQTRSYEGRNGKVYVTEIICDEVQFLSTPNSARGERRDADNRQNDLFGDETGDFVPLDDEDLPF